MERASVRWTADTYRTVTLMEVFRTSVKRESLIANALPPRTPHLHAVNDTDWSAGEDGGVTRRVDDSCHDVLSPLVAQLLARLPAAHSSWSVSGLVLLSSMVPEALSTTLTTSNESHSRFAILVIHHACPADNRNSGHRGTGYARTIPYRSYMYIPATDRYGNVSSQASQGPQGLVHGLSFLGVSPVLLGLPARSIPEAPFDSMLAAGCWLLASGFFYSVSTFSASTTRLASRLI